MIWIDLFSDPDQFLTGKGILLQKECPLPLRLALWLEYFLTAGTGSFEEIWGRLSIGRAKGFGDRNPQMLSVPALIYPDIPGRKINKTTLSPPPEKTGENSEGRKGGANPMGPMGKSGSIIPWSIIVSGRVC